MVVTGILKEEEENKKERGGEFHRLSNDLEEEIFQHEL